MMDTWTETDRCIDRYSDREYKYFSEISVVNSE